MMNYRRIVAFNMCLHMLVLCSIYNQCTDTFSLLFHVAAETLNADLEKISRWAATWLVTFNPNKSVALLLSRIVSHPLNPPLFMETHPLTKLKLTSILAYISLMTAVGSC